MGDQKSRARRFFGLSKSRITAFEQCPKKLWLSVHRRELAEVQAQSELRFAAGHEVGAIACELAPGGVMIEVQGGLFSGGRHTRGAALLKEYEKLNHAAAMGIRVLFFTPQQLNNVATYDLIRRALDR